MNKINDKEINRFLKQFSPESSQIDIGFVEDLEKRIKREYSPGSIFTPFLKLGLVSIMIFSIFIFSQYSFINTSNQTSRQVFSVSSRNREEILQRLDNERVLPLIEESINKNDFTILTANSEVKNSEIIFPSYPISYSQELPLLEIREEMFRGEKYGLCEELTERYVEGEVILSRFYKRGDSIIRSEEYLKIVDESENQSDVKGVSTITSFPTLISYPFLENYQISEGVVVDQQRYYILEIKKEIDTCQRDVLYRFMINEDSLNITEVEVFTGGQNISDLIFKTTFTISNL